MEGFLLGLTLGLAAGLSPGPLLTLVVVATLQRGFGAGLRIAVAPLITDLPIVLMALLFSSHLPPAALDALAWAGAGVVIALGAATLIGSRRAELPEGGDASVAMQADLWRGAAVNVLSPHPWIFWMSIGGPQVVGWWRSGAAPSAVSFLVCFYLLLVGSKIGLAGIVARGRRALGRAAYRGVLAACGVVLMALGGALLLPAVGRLIG